MTEKYHRLFVLFMILSNLIFLVGKQPNDPLFSDQWNLSKIDVPEAWDITKGSSSIKLAVLGIGVELDNDLKSNLTDGYNVINPGNKPLPSNRGLYHETCISGIASATTDNGAGIAGIGYNCQIVPIKFQKYNNSSEDFPTSNCAEAIKWAWENGADVINLSYAGDWYNKESVKNAINSAINNGRNGKGSIVVVSAGNNGNILFPATLSNVIAVGMTDNNDNRVSGSPKGSELDVMAPTKVPATDLMGPAGDTFGNYVIDDPPALHIQPHT